MRAIFVSNILLTRHSLQIQSVLAVRPASEIKSNLSSVCLLQRVRERQLLEDSSATLDAYRLSRLSVGGRSLLEKAL